MTEKPQSEPKVSPKFRADKNFKPIKMYRGAAGGTTGERLGDVELVKIKSEQDHVLVCSADLVNALKKEIKSIFFHSPYPPLSCSELVSVVR